MFDVRIEWTTGEIGTAARVELDITPFAVALAYGDGRKEIVPFANVISLTYEPHRA